jgi:2-polyprenyl-6-methoxyphenol hydroxylase-like FAD-dependent oxidoreductase
MAQTDVLVVGGGPTGLTLALDLARRGVPVRIIDQAPEFPDGSRGKGLSPRSLEGPPACRIVSTAERK